VCPAACSKRTPTYASSGDAELIARYRTLEVDMAPIWAAALSAFPRSHIIQVLEFLLILRKSTDA